MTTTTKSAFPSDSNYTGIEPFVKELGTAIENCKQNLTEEKFKIVIEKFNELSKLVYPETI